MPSMAAHVGSLRRAVCQPCIWSSAHGKSMPSSRRVCSANDLTSSSRCSLTNCIVASLIITPNSSLLTPHSQVGLQEFVKGIDSEFVGNLDFFV